MTDLLSLLGQLAFSLFLSMPLIGWRLPIRCKGNYEQKLMHPPDASDKPEIIHTPKERKYFLRGIVVGIPIAILANLNLLVDVSNPKAFPYLLTQDIAIGFAFWLLSIYLFLKISSFFKIKQVKKGAISYEGMIWIITAGEFLNFYVNTKHFLFLPPWLLGF